MKSGYSKPLGSRPDAREANPKKLIEDVSLEVLGQVNLSPREVSLRLSRLVNLRPSQIGELLQQADRMNALDALFAKIIFAGLTTDNIKDQVGVAEWILNRTVGKALERIETTSVAEVTLSREARQEMARKLLRITEAIDV